MSLIINIKQGDAPVSISTINRAKEPVMAARGWPQEMRDSAMFYIMMDPTSAKSQAAMAALSVFEADLVETLALNSFNAQLEAYRKAISRLSRYVLSEGREAVYEDQPTGEVDPDTFEPITTSVLVQTAIEPLDAEIEQDIRDEETGEIIGTEMVPNPLITVDVAERMVAQTTVNSTPPEVIEYAG